MDAITLPVTGESLPSPTVDPVALLLQDKRSPATRRAYQGDLKDFFGGEPGPDQVRAFVSLPPPEIALRLAQYKGQLLQRGAAEATVNRRLAAVRSLLKFCHRLGYAQTDGRGLVDGEKARAYRDTRGIDLKTVRKLQRHLQKEAKGAGTAGLRDLALLRLFIENALRRAEICGLQVPDFQPEEGRLWILGKGRGTQREPETITPAAIEAIQEYLKAASHRDGPLFRNSDHRPDHAGAGPSASRA